MKARKGFVEVFGILLVIILMVAVCLAAFGYVANIVQLCHCDFESSYKPEVIRVIGIFVLPVGVVAGYCQLKDSIPEK